MTPIWEGKPDPSDLKYWDWKDPNQKYGVADNFHFETFIEDIDTWLEKYTRQQLEDKQIFIDRIRELEDKIEAIKKLVEQDLPQILMTHYFRRKFYELTDFPAPDWFKTAMEAEDVSA